MRNIILLFAFFFTCSNLLAHPLWQDDRAFNERIHVIQPKETLYKISRQHGISVAAIRKSNGIDGNIISAGARLKIRIPAENDIFQVHIVRVDESLEIISDKYLLPLDILTKYNDLDENVVFPGQRIFIKIDKINTKYTYTGEEDMPLTDAELGDNQNQFNVTANGSGNDAPELQPKKSDQKSTPVYILNTKPANGELKDSISNKSKAFTIEGYLDAYYAQYSDKNQQGELASYAISAPKHNQTGINTAQFAAIYSDTTLRGNITVQYGDLVNAVYPTDYKFLQQANVGFKIAGNLWFDAGFFRSPVSVEDFPNRNNYSSTYSYTRYFEPVLMSGAKLGWEAKRIRFTAFVADRTFAIGNSINKQPSFGANLKIYGGKYWLFGANGMYSNSNDGFTKAQRTYANVYLATNRKHIDVLAYANYAQVQSKTMYSGLLNVRYKITPKFSLFAKGEYFADSAAAVSPLMTGTDGKQQGLSATAIGGGFEFKARPNHYLRIEARQTQLGSNFAINPDYFNGGGLTNQRLEFVVTTGIWFGK